MCCIKKNRRVGYSTKEGITIWYLLPCRNQEVELTLDSCRKYLSDKALLDAFVLTYDRLCRYQGAWHLEKRLIFPANVVLESENENALIDELKHHPDAAAYACPVFKIDLEEETFLRYLCGKMRHIGMSRGVICDGITQVTEGPLKGLESQICKIDRHKRLAKLWTPKRQDSRYIPAGLEIVAKTI